MRTCSLCHHQSADSESICTHCGADLDTFATTAVALARYQENPRVALIRVIVPHSACTACRAIEGTYEKTSVPALPVPGCCCEHGCSCTYEPLLSEVYP